MVTGVDNRGFGFFLSSAERGDGAVRSAGAFIKAIPKSEGITATEFGVASEELFGRIMELTDNAGATDERRAMNYLALSYPAIYAKAADFACANRNTDFTEKLFRARGCDGGASVPLVKMSPYSGLE